MRAILPALILATLSGCAQVAGSLPSMQYCDQVVYVRKGNQIDLQAQCRAPIGGSLPTP